MMNICPATDHSHLDIRAHAVKPGTVLEVGRRRIQTLTVAAVEAHPTDAAALTFTFVEGGRPLDYSPSDWVRVQVDRQQDIDAMEAEIAAAAPVCDYFILCDLPAVGTLPNPVLGPVNTCQRCADRMGAGDRLTPFPAR